MAQKYKKKPRLPNLGFIIRFEEVRLLRHRMESNRKISIHRVEGLDLFEMMVHFTHKV